MIDESHLRKDFAMEVRWISAMKGYLNMQTSQSWKQRSYLSWQRHTINLELNICYNLTWGEERDKSFGKAKPRSFITESDKQQ